MSFNSNVRSQSGSSIRNSDVRTDITKSVQLLLSGALLVMASKAGNGYVDSRMSHDFIRPEISLLAFDSHSGKYFVVDWTLYDLVKGVGKTSTQAARDAKILQFITDGGECPTTTPQLRDKIGELRMEYLSRIDDLKEQLR